MNQTNNNIFHWAVIGAGGAGIAAVGKLLDNGVEPSKILWIDPFFKVGDLGKYWSNVSSNTKVRYFNDFLLEVSAFNYKDIAKNFYLHNLPLDHTCLLKYVVEPLQWVSDNLVKKVQAQQTTVNKIFLSERVWSLCTEEETFKAQNVILATGALPSTLNYPGVDIIPFEVAIDKERLINALDIDKTYAVFGSSHSAVIILRYLVELGVQKVINFYRSPCCYAVDMDGWILYDNTGLKGQAALWAREYIDGTHPANLVRYNTNPSNISHYLPQCDKVIYAVGFEKRQSLIIENYEHLKHNPHVGIIAPGLFGFGIAYPEIKTDLLGIEETQVGLWKFMVYLEKVLPLWFKYST